MKRSNADPAPAPYKIPKMEEVKCTDQVSRAPELDYRHWLMHNIKDCTIVAGNASKLSFGAFRGALVLKSSVLYNLLFKPAYDNVYHLPEVTSQAFELLMPFFYQVEKDINIHLISNNIALELLEAVCYLQIHELMDPILVYLAINLDADSIFSALDLLKKCRSSRLEKACHDVLSTEMTACLNNNSFLELPLPNLLEFCKRERFCPEVEMLKALERYAAHNGLQRGTEDKNSAILENILRKIHFFMIPSNELFEPLANAKLLTDREKILIGAYSVKADTDLPLPSIISAEEKNFSLFIVKIFTEMRELFPKVGKRLFKCTCGMKHNVRFDFWDHDYGKPDELKRLEIVLKAAGLPNNLEVIAKTEVSAVQRAIGRFMRECSVFKDIFNISAMEKFLI